MENNGDQQNASRNNPIIFLFVGLFGGCFLALCLVLVVIVVVLPRIDMPGPHAANGEKDESQTVSDSEPDKFTRPDTGKENYEDLKKRNSDPLHGAATREINPFYANLQERDLSYRWKAGDEYSYQFSIRTDSPTRPLKIEGNMNLRIGDTQLIAEEHSGSGTAFVIAKDGYLATCAHVVKYAKRIRVLFGESNHFAKIVAVDDALDVAILKIENADLTPLQLSPRATIDLAENVLVLGYPMTKVLGESIKVSRGIVSGVSQVADGQQVSIDGAINPGNSGGPVVNEAGQVAAIASATLQGERISAVGFASPVKGLVELMRKNNISFTESDSNGSGSPSMKDIVKQISPSVGLVHADGWADDRFTNINYDASYSDSRRGSVTYLINGVKRTGELRKGSLQVSSLGDIRAGASKSQLPYFLGTMPELVVEQFELTSQKNWTVHRPFRIALSNRPAARSPLDLLSPGLLSPINRRGFFPSFLSEPNTQQTTYLEAEEKLEFEVVDTDDDLLIIEKQYQLSTSSKNNQPLLTAKGSGTWKFDKARGLPVSIDQEVTFTQRDTNSSVKTPVLVKAELRSPSDVAKERQRAQKEKAELERLAKIEQTQPNPKLVTQLVAEAQGAVSAKRTLALDRLSRIAIANEMREEVLDLVRPLVVEARHIDHLAFKCYLHWADESCLEDLRRIAFKSTRFNSHFQRDALAAVAKQKDPQDLPRLFQLLRDTSVRSDATKAISAFGELAEAPALAAIRSTNDTFEVIALLNIISNVGGRKSLGELQSLIESRNEFDFKLRAENTIRKLQTRLQQ